MSGPLDPQFSSLVDPSGNALVINPNGSISNAPVDGTKNTYSWASLGIAPATTATDVATLTGSSTKTVRVLRAEISGTQTTDGQITIMLLKRLSADTGGTPTTSSNIAGYDSFAPVSTAIARSYTANPSVGSPSTLIRSAIMYVPAVLTAATPSDIVWTFGDRPGQGLVLRGPNEILAFNLNAATIVGGNFVASFEWTEE